MRSAIIIGGLALTVVSWPAVACIVAPEPLSPRDPRIRGIVVGSVETSFERIDGYIRGAAEVGITRTLLGSRAEKRVRLEWVQGPCGLIYEQVKKADVVVIYLDERNLPLGWFTWRLAKLRDNRLKGDGSPANITFDPKTLAPASTRRTVQPISARAGQLLPAQPLQPRTQTTDWITNDDYPDAALRRREEGTSVAGFAVGADGRLSDCRIVKSSGSVSLDSAVCTLLIRRARFVPPSLPGSRVGNYRMKWRLPPQGSR